MLGAPRIEMSLETAVLELFQSGPLKTNMAAASQPASSRRLQGPSKTPIGVPQVNNKNKYKLTKLTCPVYRYFAPPTQPSTSCRSVSFLMALEARAVTSTVPQLYKGYKPRCGIERRTTPIPRSHTKHRGECHGAAQPRAARACVHAWCERAPVRTSSHACGPMQGGRRIKSIPQGPTPCYAACL